VTSKLERQLTLLDVLLRTNRHLALDDIAARVPGYAADPESFRRTFERDKVDLRAMGVPLDLATVPGSDPPTTGYRVHPGSYALPDPGLEPDELEALLLAAALVGGSGLTGALLKLGAGVAEARPSVEVPTDPELTAIFTAVAERRALRFAYKGVDRQVQPHRLQFARGRWYLNGFDLTRDAMRWYRVERIDGAVEVGEEAGAFDPPAGERSDEALRVDPWVLGEPTEAVTARLRFDPAVAGAARRELGDAEVVRDDEDGLVVDLTVTNRAGLRSWLLTYLDRAEVLAPEDLRDEVVGWLEAIAGG